VIYLDEDLCGEAIKAALGWYWGAVQEVTSFAPKGLDVEDLWGRLAQEKDFIFVTNNTADFWNKLDGHPRYSILCVDADKGDAELVSHLIRSALRLDPLRTARSRRGWMVRVSASGIRYYRRRSDGRVLHLTFDSSLPTVHPR
jgi:hypothetical protein